ncbi:MAG: CRISPR-associated protein Cas4 [Candidatus Anstonellales archaeon]
MNQEGFYTARDVLNFSFCPRIIYFEHVLKIPQKTTVKEFEGRRIHEKFTQASKRTKIIKEFPNLEKHYNVFLKDEKLHFLTVIDCVAINYAVAEAYPIQVKNMNRPKSLFRSIKYQCIGEAHLILEKLGFYVPSAYIKFLKTNDVLKVPINSVRIEEFKNILGQIDRIARQESIPEPTDHKRKCANCCFLNLCKRI